MMGAALKERKKDKVSNIEWLGQQMRAKTANFEQCTQDTNLEPITWQDRCGVFAHIESELGKAVGALLIWGHAEKQAYDYAKEHLASIMIRNAVIDGKGEPKLISLKKLASGVSFMLLEFSMDNRLEENFTAKGRLYFAGIGANVLNYDAYRMSWLKYERLMEVALYSAIWEVEMAVEKYRKDLKQ